MESKCGGVYVKHHLPCPRETEVTQLRAERDRYKAEGSAADFACHLINHCEREIVTEEFVQRWLAAYLAAAVRG